jgi:hypothetical protein
MEVFMDDFSVYGKSFGDCLENLDKVLKRCQETNLVLNWEKCHFMVSERIVLGHKVLEKGICGRINLNYTGSSTQVLSQGLQRASNGVSPWPVGLRPDKPPNAGSNRIPRMKASPEIQMPTIFTSQI